MTLISHVNALSYSTYYRFCISSLLSLPRHFLPFVLYHLPTCSYGFVCLFPPLLLLSLPLLSPPPRAFSDSHPLSCSYGFVCQYPWYSWEVSSATNERPYRSLYAPIKSQGRFPHNLGKSPLPPP